MILEHRATDHVSGRTTFRPVLVRYGAAITEKEYLALNLLPDFIGWCSSLPSLDDALFLTHTVGGVRVTNSGREGYFIYFSLVADHDTFEERRKIAAIIEAFCDKAVAKREEDA